MSTLVNFSGTLIDRDLQLAELDRADFEDDLYLFFKNAWRWIDSSEFSEGWPIEAVAEHLQGVVDGDIRKLIVNIPPRCAKSSLVSVAFPAWVWAQPDVWNSPTSGPGVQFLHASYAQQLSLRDSVKCRRLIESPWYQKLWGPRYKLSPDQNTKTRFDNDKSGARLATSVGSALTGEGGNIIIVDDPNSAQEAFSDAAIHSTIEWWDTALSTRLNDPKTGAFIVIQQRLSEEDLTGHILSRDHGDWTHLCLPMRYEWNRHSVTSIGWNDPRGLDVDGSPLVTVGNSGERVPVSLAAQEELNRREGALLWPERFGEKEVSDFEKERGPWIFAGQFQQRPEPKGGGIIKADWWQPWEATEFPLMDLIIATLDTAYTTKTENDPSAMSVWGVFTGAQTELSNRYVSRDNKNVLSDNQSIMFDETTKIRTGYGFTENSSPKVMLMYAWQGRYELHELVKKVSETCKKLKVDKVLIENKAAGHSVAQELRRLYGGEKFSLQMYDPKSQDKLSRLHSVEHLFAEGMVYAPNKQWAEMLIRQVSQFPKGKHDDLVDTTSMALRHLRDIGVLLRNSEWTADFEDSMRFKGKSEALPLYPV